MTRIPGIVLDLPSGSIAGQAISSVADIAHTQLAQRPLQPTGIPLTRCRVWDAMQTTTPGTAASDDLGLITGTPGTHAPKLSSGDVKNSTTSRKAAFELEVPSNYDDGQTFQLRMRAAVETTVASASCTLDLEVFKPDGDGLVGSDLCQTAAQIINSLTKANFDFTIDASALNPGDKLICIITIACTDVATGTAVTPCVYEIIRLADLRG